jgi:hypothetical protein
MRISCWGLAAFAVAVSFSQSPPAPVFELILPDLNRAIPGGTEVVADIPIRQINQMTIQVLGSADTNLTYGDLRVRINGKGTRNVFDTGSNARGKYLTMNSGTLRMRRDQIFDREENSVEIYGKDKRGREYYQNWILRSGGDNANPYFTYVSSMSPTDETGVPPDLALDAPASPVVFPSGKDTITVHLKGSVSAAGGVSSVTVNGKSGATPGRATSAKIEQDAIVTRGSKALIVEATDSKGNKRSASIPVVYPGSSNPAPKLAGQSWAVVIGISQFTAKTGAPPSLPLAAFDATEMVEKLKARGFKDENVRLLVDDQATAERVRTALGDFTAKAKPDDLLLVYWATQGLHDPASPDKVYLSASDTQSLHLADTAIEISELQLLLERSVRSRHTLLFFDAEHPLGGDWAFQGKSIVNTHLLNLFDDQLGRSVLVAGPSSSESPRSAFSAAVFEGLAGKADIDQNHVVTAKEICDYVSEQVRVSSGGGQVSRARVSKHDEETPVLALK